MKALYIGYSKTGTKTMHVVFETLGYKVYDYEENFVLLGDEWERILKHGATPDDFKRMYADVDASVDVPVYIFREEILQAFPDVKLLVSFRTEDDWFKSWKKQCNEVDNDWNFRLLTYLSPTANKFSKRLDLFGKHAFGSERISKTNPNLMRKRYKQHNLNIQTNAPKDQLHVVDFSKGWGPICEFLGTPVPDIEFPHANKTGKVLKESMEKNPIFIKMKQEVLLSFCAITVSIAFGSYCFYSFIFNK